MTAEDYKKTFADNPVSEKRLKILDNLEQDELKETIQILKDRKKAGYQELLNYFE